MHAVYNDAVSKFQHSQGTWQHADVHNTKYTTSVLLTTTVLVLQLYQSTACGLNASICCN